MKYHTGKACVATFVAIAVEFAASGSARADYVFAWGDNATGKLGLGGTGVVDKYVPTLTLLPSTITSVAATAGTAIALDTSGAVYAWGSNNGGALGNGGTAIDFSAHGDPTPVSGLPSGSGVTAIGTQGGTAMAIKSGAVYSWGFNGGAQGGTGSNSPANLFSATLASQVPTGVTAIGGSSSAGFAVSGGALYGWGANTNGELGLGDKTVRTSVQLVTGMSSGVTAVSGGQAFGAAVKDGNVYAWGSNGLGQLGNGTSNNPATPGTAALVTGLPAGGVTQLATGLGYGLALRGNTVYAWGYNSNGQLGNGTTTNALSAFAVTGITGTIVDIAAGGYSSYVLVDDGSLWVWGSNATGQLGLGDLADRLTPTHLLAPDGYKFTSISSGITTATTTGTVYATAVAIPEPLAMSLLVPAIALLSRRRRLT